MATRLVRSRRFATYIKSIGYEVLEGDVVRVALRERGRAADREWQRLRVSFFDWVIRPASCGVECCGFVSTLGAPRAAPVPLDLFNGHAQIYDDDAYQALLESRRRDAVAAPARSRDAHAWTPHTCPTCGPTPQDWRCPTCEA